MNRIIDLQTALLDLLQKVNDSDVRLIAGGGFGIYLKTDYATKSGMRTLLDQWPEPQSTNDLDLFLRPELLIESSKLKPLVSAIAELGYEVVPGAEKYQFVKPGPGGTDVGGISTPERLGMIRLRESPYFRPELQTEKFMSALQELFPAWAESSHGLAE